MKTLAIYFIYFITYSVIGWIYETVLCSLSAKKYINRGFLNGPYCPIYGCGAVIDILFLKSFNGILPLFLLGALLNITLEYITSYLMEKIFHARWWDYSERKFNIKGRVCLIGAVVFGIFAVFLLKFIHPFITSLYSNIPVNILYILSFILFVVFLWDNIYTISKFAGLHEKVIEFHNTVEEKRREFHSKISGDNKIIAEYIKNRKLYEAFTNKLNKQQKRMIKSFPQFHIIKKKELVKRLREIINEKK